MKHLSLFWLAWLCASLSIVLVVVAIIHGSQSTGWRVAEYVLFAAAMAGFALEIVRALIQRSADR